MLNKELKYLWQMLLIVVFQVMVFNHFHLLGYATPIITPLLLVYFPINDSRVGGLLRAFATGLCVDYLSGTPGQNSAALTFTAMVRPTILGWFAPREHLEDMVPSYRQMGRTRHSFYMLTLVIIHHVVFFALEALSYFTHVHLLISLGSSILLTMVIMLALESLRDRKPLQE